MRLANKVAMVTGAGSGVGRATAQLFAQEGAKVVCVDVNDEDGGATSREISQAGGDSIYFHVDVRLTEQVNSAVRVAEETFGHLHIMVANAGTVGGNAVGRPMEDLTDEQWAGILDVNLTGVFRCFRAAIPAIRRSGGGALSATASIAALTGVAGQSAYSASKGGIVSLVRSLAYQLAGDHIRVNCVCPGGVRTNLLRDTDLAAVPNAGSRASPAETGEDLLADGNPILLLRRAGEPAEVAHAHLFLVSDEGSFVNGHPLVTDAGSMAANTWMVVNR